MNSDYQRFVAADFAPADGLQDREGEIAALYTFCEGDRPYGWWQGAPWAGKTALMASLIARPPDGYSVICYFISRRSGRNTYADFTATVLRQLAELTGDELSAVLSDSERDEQWRRLLDQAAAQALSRGERLLLVIDGLDEESTTGAPTIATALPRNPPEGLRIIVTSRPNSPVPAGHPLNQCVPVVLDASQHATDIRDLAREELSQYLSGQDLREQIVGFLAAAQGALTSTNLGELIGELPYEIRDELNGSRIVSHQDATDSDRPAYVLGHDELVAGAVEALGKEEIGERWDRIHAWAQGYRRRSWPENTPGFLLREYPQRLAEKQDLDRLHRLALDGARHNRMLDITGGDTAAFAEIAAAQRLIAESAEPDLRVAYLLARHRDDLAARHVDIPSALPAVWFTLGDQRADARAASLSAGRRDPAYRQLAVAAARIRRRDQAQVFVGRISASGRVRALAEVAQAAAAAGDHAGAREVADSIIDVYWRLPALASVAQIIADAGDYATAADIADDAATSARAVSSPIGRASALADVARAMAAAGHHAAARRMAGDAEEAARSITADAEQAMALAKVAEAMAAAGDRSHASVIADEAAAVARSKLPPAIHEFALLNVVEAVARVRNHAAARKIAESITDPDRRGWAVGLTAKAAAATGDYAAAREIADSITQLSRQAEARAAIAETAAAAGIFSEARKIANSVKDPDLRNQTLCNVALAIAASGDHATAREIAEWVDSAVRMTGTPTQQTEPVTTLVSALASAGDYTTAAEIARSIADPNQRIAALVRVAHAAAAADNGSFARDIAGEAQAVIQLITVSGDRDLSVSAVAPALAAAADHRAARAIAHTIEDPARRVSTLSAVAQAVAGNGKRPAAREILDEALEVASSVTGGYERGVAKATVVEAMASMGDHDAALESAQTIFAPKAKDTALAAVAKAVVSAGQYTVAAGIAGSIGSTARRALLLAEVSRAAAAAGEHSTALEIAHTAEAIAKTIYEQSLQTSALGAAAEAMAAAGDRTAAQRVAEQAEMVAESIREQSLRAAALGAVAQAMAAAGDQAAAGRITGHAETAAQSIMNVDMRAAALAGVARAAAAAAEYDTLSSLLSEASAQVICNVARDLVNRGEDSAARVLMVRAWMATTWHKPLLALSVVDPGLLIRIAKEVLTPVELDIWDSAADAPRAVDTGGFERMLNGIAGYCDPETYKRWIDEGSARIARIYVGGQAVGTGFLVGPDLLMTNWHVVADAKEFGGAAHFKFGATAQERIVRFAENWQVAHSAHGNKKAETSSEGPARGTWDFAIVRLVRQVDEDTIIPGSVEPALRGYYTLDWDSYSFHRAEPILIYGYPSGFGLVFSYASPSGAQLTISGSRVRYDTNTDHGSSGSPVFNREFRIVALHNSSGAGSDMFNQGVPMKHIGEELRAQLGDQHTLQATLGLT